MTTCSRVRRSVSAFAMAAGFFSFASLAESGDGVVTEVVSAEPAIVGESDGDPFSDQGGDLAKGAEAMASSSDPAAAAAPAPAANKRAVAAGRSPASYSMEQEDRMMASMRARETATRSSKPKRR